MKNILPQIDSNALDTVAGGKKTPTPKGGDGESIVRLDQRFQTLEPALKGKTKGHG